MMDGSSNVPAHTQGAYNIVYIILYMRITRRVCVGCIVYIAKMGIYKCVYELCSVMSCIYNRDSVRRDIARTLSAVSCVEAAAAELPPWERVEKRIHLFIYIFFPASPTPLVISHRVCLIISKCTPPNINRFLRDAPDFLGIGVHIIIYNIYIYSVRGRGEQEV